MNLATPNLPPQATSTESDGARIGVGILTLPDTCTVRLSLILESAMLAGLKRADVAAIKRVTYFKNIFSVSIFTVAKSARGQAVASLKETLKELVLLELATIATDTADDCWLTIHGLGLGGIQFTESFLKPEDIRASAIEFQKYQAQAILMREALTELLKTHTGAEGNTDSK